VRTDDCFYLFFVFLLLLLLYLEERLNLGDTGGTTDEDNVVNGLLLDLGVLEDLVDGLEAASEKLNVELLKLGTGDGAGKVDAIKERVNLNGGLGGGREVALCALAGGAETADGTGALAQVLLVLLLELTLKVLDHAVVKVLTTEVSVTSGGLDGEDARVDGEEGNIEGTATEIEDEDGALLLLLVVARVETVGDGGSGGLVDDTEDLEAGNETGILGGLKKGEFFNSTASEILFL